MCFSYLAIPTAFSKNFATMHGKYKLNFQGTHCVSSCSQLFELEKMFVLDSYEMQCFGILSKSVLID